MECGKTNDAAVKGGCENCVRHKLRPRDEESLRRLQSRLNRMIGQLSGIGRMLDDNRYCGDILTQVAAVESALQAFGYIILQEHMETCVMDAVCAGEKGSMEEVMALIKKLK